MAVIVGLLGAWLLVIVGMLLKGGSILGILNLPAALMVIGGTTGVIVASFGLRSIKDMATLTVRVAMRNAPDRRRERVQALLEFADIGRREGLLAMESKVAELDDPQMTRGLRMVIDGADPQLIKDILETEMDATEERHARNQKMFSQAGAFAPTIGIMATVLSLVSVLQHLDQPDTLGPAISAAFLATFYGVAVANVGYLPIANALKNRTDAEMNERLMVLEGILAIQSGDNPRALADKLWSFFAPSERPDADADASSDREPEER